MAYDPADLRLPPWLIHTLDMLVSVRIPLPRGWFIGITRAGAMMVASTLGVWASAFYSANNLLYLCGAILLMMMLGALWQGVRILHALPDITPAMPRWLEAESPLILHQKTDHTTGLVAQIDIIAEHWSLQWWSGGQHAHLSGRLQYPQRGILASNKLRCVTSAPIGMWQLVCPLSVSVQIPVLPVRVPLPVQSPLHMNKTSPNAQQNGDDFEELRSYSPGDAIARIHWRKAGEEPKNWRVKHFSYPLQDQPSADLIVDLRRPSHCAEQDFERLLGMAWQWISTHWQQKQHINSVTIGDQCFSMHDEVQQQACLLALASCQPQSTPPQHGVGYVLSLCN